MKQIKPPKLTPQQQEEMSAYYRSLQRKSHRARLKKYGKEGLSKLMIKANKKRWANHKKPKASDLFC